MNECKHHCYYAYESFVDEHDVKGSRLGWEDTTVPCIFVGKRMAFCDCSKCGNKCGNILIAEKRLKKNE